MNNKILIITVLLTNIAFADVLVVKPMKVSSKVKQSAIFTNRAISQLCNKGLEKDAAMQKISQSLVHDASKTDFMAKNLLKKFPALKAEHITNYMSTSALFNKNVDLSSYENLLSLVQKNSSYYLDKEKLVLLQDIANENKNLFV